MKDGNLANLNYSIESVAGRSASRRWARRLLPFVFGEVAGLLGVLIWDVARGFPIVGGPAKFVAFHLPQLIAHFTAAMLLYVLSGRYFRLTLRGWDPDWIPLGLLSTLYPLTEYGLALTGDFEDWRNFWVSTSAHALSMFVHWCGPTLIVAFTAGGRERNKGDVCAGKSR